jgi:hypothetical protein
MFAYGKNYNPGDKVTFEVEVGISKVKLTGMITSFRQQTNTIYGQIYVNCKVGNIEYSGAYVIPLYAVKVIEEKE